MKDNLEKSLKRYLKRKVKITLGFVTAFAIIGNVGLASESVNFIKADEALKGLGSNGNFLNSETIERNDKKIIITNDNNSKINIKFENFNYKDANGETEISSDIVSTSIANNIQKAVENIKNNELNDKSIPENNGILDLSGNTPQVNKGGIVVNNGLIVGQYGQRIASNEQMYNYGIIKTTLNGQYINNAISGGAKGYNYGIVIGATSIQNLSINSLFENHGLILGKQEIQGGEDNTINNYGVVYSANDGQKLTFYNDGRYTDEKSRNLNLNNFGIIKTNATTTNAGQIITGYSSATGDKSVINSFLKNYGLIDSSTHGQYIYQGENNKAENYGVIKTGKNGYAINVRNGVDTTNDIAKNNGGTNYGTVIKTEGTNVFSNGVVNKGIVIVDNSVSNLDDYSLGDNKGIVIKQDGTLLNSDNIIEYNGSSEISNSFSDGKSTAFVKSVDNKIMENLKDKVIGTVVDENNKDNTVFKAEKDIVLENTVLTGYFKENGTLLDMGNNNLTLLGDAKIVTSKDNFELDNVVALNIDGVLKMIGDAEVAGKITGNGDISTVAKKGTMHVDSKDVLLQNAVGKEKEYLGENKNYTDITFDELKTKENLKIDFKETEAKQEGETAENKITFTDNLEINAKDGIAIDGKSTTKGNNIHLIFSSLSGEDGTEKVKGDIVLGASDDTIEVGNNSRYNYTMDMGSGEDTLILKHGAESDEEHIKNEVNTFNYNVMNTEIINLEGGHWHIDGAHIGFDENNGDTPNNVTINVGTEETDGELHVEINSKGIGQEVSSTLDGIVDKGTELTINASDGIKYVAGDNFNVLQDKYEFTTDYKLGKDTEIKGAVIFDTKDSTVSEDGTGKVVLRVKEAEELGLEKYKGIYDTVLKTLSKNKELRDAVNYYDQSRFTGMIRSTDDKASALYTTGYAVTKDVADAYTDTVESFGKKAGKGEWLAFAKYINSDTEFDGGSSSKGYDADITGAVGMIEYGATEKTSYGAVFGQGDTEADINGGGKLDGDSTYFGAYMKHRTESGIELLGNIGFLKSELDADFRSFAPVGDVDYTMITEGNSDADALALSLKGKKAFPVNETLRIEPAVKLGYTLINQDAVESSDANFRIDEKDVTIFEGALGADVVKDFAVFEGKLSIKAGAEYSMLSVNDSDDARYTLYGNEIAIVDEEEIADGRLKAHIGIDYEHENGMGFDAEYQYIWTDKGDDDRITAGISYRF